MNSPGRLFFWLDEMYGTYLFFFLFGVGGLCVGFIQIHLSVCFWFGWDKMKVQQVKIKQYVYIYTRYRLQMLDECF